MVTKSYYGYFLMSVIIRIFIFISSLGVVLSCQNNVRKPAVINSQQDRQVISNTIAQMLYLERVVLADNAFSLHNEISIFRTTQIGRELTAPANFSLWLEQSQCVLIHAEKDNKVALPVINCQELP
jgi:hypothetical protein